MKLAKYVAYDAGNCESETFDTFEEAERWLDECNSEGISIEMVQGYSYIAKITHRSHFEVTDKKSNYHEHTESCPEDCAGEEWPHDSDFDEVGDVLFLPVEEPSAEGLREALNHGAWGCYMTRNYLSGVVPEEEHRERLLLQAEEWERQLVELKVALLSSPPTAPGLEGKS